MTETPNTPMSKVGRMALKNVNLMKLFGRHILTHFETIWKALFDDAESEIKIPLMGSLQLPNWMNFQNISKGEGEVAVSYTHLPLPTNREV